MNLTIERLVQVLKEKIPGLFIIIDEPNDPNGSWFIDISHPKSNKFFVVEYSAKFNMYGLISGLTSGGINYDIDETYQDSDGVIERIEWLYVKGKNLEYKISNIGSYEGVKITGVEIKEQT